MQAISQPIAVDLALSWAAYACTDPFTRALAAYSVTDAKSERNANAKPVAYTHTERNL